MFETLPETARLRRVEFLTRDRGVLQADVRLSDGEALAPFMGRRDGSVNLVDAWWVTSGARADDLTLRLSEIVWARSLDTDVAVAADEPGQREGRQVELVLAGDVVLRGGFSVLPGQSISEHLGVTGDFPVLRAAHLDGIVPLGDVVVNQGALRSVREVRSSPVQGPAAPHEAAVPAAPREAAVPAASHEAAVPAAPHETAAAGSAEAVAREAVVVRAVAEPVTPLPARSVPRGSARPESGSVTDLLIGILEFRDPFFRGSSSLTRLLCIEIGREMDLSEEDVAALAQAALLRDLGRMVEDGVLGRKLSVVGDEEVKRRGLDQINLTMALLGGVDMPAAAKEAIQFHHERFDGTGYPEGRRADEIPLTARILAVAESYAAIIAPRPHRPPRRIEAAMDELQASAGRQLDPVVIFALGRVLRAGDPHVLRFGLRHHVLVVQPDAHRGTTLALRFCSHGYLGESIPDLDAARERLKRVPIEAVIMSADIAVDELRDFLGEIRSSRYFASLPAIVVDAASSESRAALLDAGADRCFAVETGFDEIRASLGGLIGRIASVRSSARHDGPAVPYAPWHALQGELVDFSLPWLLQMLRYDSRTACVLVSRDSDHGVIYIEDGEPRHASTGALLGEPALREILAWRQGDFVVQPEVPAPQRTIDASLMQVLLEEAVIEDSANVIFGAVP